MSAIPRYWSIPMLRITGCTDRQMWYAGLVGQLVPYEADDGQYGYRSREPAGYVNFVRREDATPTRVRVHTIHRQRWPFNSPDRAAVVIELTRQRCGAVCDELGVCQGLRHCKHAPAAPIPAGTMPQQQQSGQSRRHSLAETITNVAVGFVVSLAITAWLLPAMGHQVTVTENVLMTSVFTVASVIRGYALRRLFNRWSA